MSSQSEQRGSPYWIAILVVVSVLPLTSAVASFLDLRELLLLVFFLLGLAVFIVLPDMDAAVRDNFFVLVTLSVSLSLLMSATLISDNLHGYDIHQEYSLFLQVMRSGKWNPESGLLYNSALSISVLPSILSIVSGLDGVRIFMLAFPALYSIVPVVLYRTYRLFVRAEAAFLSVFLFMSYGAFYGEMTMLARQEVAEVVLVLLLWFMLSREMKPRRSQAIVMMILAIGLVVSHYSLTYVYIGILFVSMLAPLIFERTVALRNLTWILLVGAMSLVWYMLAAGGIAFATIVDFLSFTAQGLVRDFLNPVSRPTIFLEATGLASVTPGILHDVNRLTNYLVVAMLVLGFVSFLRKRRKSVTERAVLPLMAAGFLILILSVVVPSFASGLNFSRFYHIALILISPCFVYGAELFGHVLGKVRAPELNVIPKMNRLHFKKLVLPACILMCYFLFTSGWMWAVSMDIPTSLILDRERVRTYPDPSLQVTYYNEYSISPDVEAARWLKAHMAYGRSLCADYTSRYHVLNSYGEFPREGPVLPWGCDFSNSYVFLGALNTLYGIGTYWEITWSMSVISANLGDMDRIYSNGSTIIYS